MAKVEKDGPRANGCVKGRSWQVIKGRIHVETVEWVSLVVVTPNKDGRWRVCVDFKPLNAPTKNDPYAPPFIDQILDSIAGYERYNVRDNFSSYFQLKIALEDQNKTTFVNSCGYFVIYFCLMVLQMD